MFKGQVFKDGKFWAIKVPDLDLATEGYTKDEAYEMLADLLQTATQKSFKIDIAKFKNNTFLLQGKDDQSQKDLIALMFKRQRAKSHLSLTDMARLLKARSKNSYARYEHGDCVPSYIMMTKILRIMGLSLEMNLHKKSNDNDTTIS